MKHNTRAHSHSERASRAAPKTDEEEARRQQPTELPRPGRAHPRQQIPETPHTGSNGHEDPRRPQADCLHSARPELRDGDAYSFRKHPPGTREAPRLPKEAGQAATGRLRARCAPQMVPERPKTDGKEMARAPSEVRRRGLGKHVFVFVFPVPHFLCCISDSSPSRSPDF